jgi:hypothetical protein
MNILALDQAGIYTEQCAALGKKGDVNRYWTSWEADQKFDYYATGIGFGNLEKVKYAAEWYEKSDLIFNPNVTGQDTISFLRKIYPNKSIFGCGMAFKLEQERWSLKKVLKSIDIKFAQSERIIGVDALRDYFINNKDKFVKISTFRGDTESFYAKDGKSIDLKLDEISAQRGPFKNNMEFIVEDTIDSDVEIGADLIFNGNDYLKPYLYGYEICKGFYLGRISEELPYLLKDVMDKLKPVLRKLDYRSCISTEIKCVDKKTSYFLDITCRLPNPLCALYNEYIKNWRDVVYATGLKKDIRLDIKHKYVGAFFLNSSHGHDHYIKIDVEEKDRDHIKFVSVAQNDGSYYSVKGTEKICVLIAGGQTVQEVIDTIKKYVSKVNADGLEKDAVYAMDKVIPIIDAGKRMGLEF